MLTRLLANNLLVNIAYIKICVHLTFVLVHLRKKLGAPVQPVQKFSLDPCIDAKGFLFKTMEDP